MSRLRVALFGIALALAVVVPIGAAATSPLLAWRDPVYIAAGLAGVIALVAMLFQPLLALVRIRSIAGIRGPRIHRWVGSVLVLLVIVHVAGLWITSPPDVVDALLFVSPTPFSIWGVIAMWSLFATAGLVAFRRFLRLQPGTWRLCHKVLAAVIATMSVAHAIMIEGTMEVLSKSVLCAMVLAATLVALAAVNHRS